jgi:predicted CXXCH cytochrome family protein
VDVLIKHLTRRRSGAVVSRDETLTCEQVRFGRSTENEVGLLDHRVLLDEGALHLRQNGLFYEAAPQATALIDGRVASSGPVAPGSTIQIGPYAVVVMEPADGTDVTVSVEMTRAPDDSLAQLKARSRTSLTAAGWNRRPAAWALTLLVLGLFLAWPVADYLIDRSAGPRADIPMQEMPAANAIWPVKADLAWDSGEISGPHKFIAEDCGACHKKAFEQVPDTACLTCHKGIPHHVEPAAFAGAGGDIGALTGVACQSCHKEHRGPAHIVRNDQAFCADCHGELTGQAPRTTLLDASDFGRDHPQFRPTVVVDGDTGRRERVALDKAAWPVEQSNLRFPHDAHLKPGGIRFPGEAQFTVLQCATCHQPEQGGVGMRPIAMEQHCADCHQLRFEPEVPERTLPHGDLKGALLTIKEFYADMALRGGARAGETPAVVRRRPGAALSAAQRLTALAWADEQAGQAALYASKSVCGTCHVMAQSVTADSIDWTVKKVDVADRWMPKGLFDHGQHTNMDCTACHTAETSKQSTDVLLPQIGLCQQCHGGAEATNRVPTGCIRCHGFHFDGQPPMGPAPADSAALGGGAR